MINEVQYDTLQSGTDSAWEWVEIYNPTCWTIDLVGWSIADNTSSDALPSLSLPARGFAIIAASANFSSNFPDCDCSIVFIVGSIGNGLSNTNDSVILKDSAGTTIDAISYGNNAPLPDVAEGHSLERSPAGGTFIDNPNPSPCSAIPTPTPTPSTTPTESLTPSTTLTLSPTTTPTESTTPTTTTSPTATPTPSSTSTTSNTTAVRGDVLINEVQYNPPQPGSDANFEWLELFNPTNNTVSLVGWEIRDNRASDVIPTLNLSSGGFALVAASSDFYANFPECDCTVLFTQDGRIGNGLGNDGDRLILEDSAGTVIDAISYGNDNSSASTPFPKVAENHSMERSPAGGDFVDNPNPDPCYGLSPSTPTVTLTVSPTTTPAFSPTPTPSAGPTTPHPTATPTLPTSGKATAQPSEPYASARSLTAAIVASEAVALFGVAILIRNKIGKKPR